MKHDDANLRSATAVRTLSWALVLALLGGFGCAASDDQQDPGFFTSGSREADQRAEQRVAKLQQMRGKGADEQDPQAEAAKKSLYDRLGGAEGIRAIVDDFVVRAVADPRVNWERKGVRTGGFLRIGRRNAEWQANDQNSTRLKKHLAQFLSLATGGPSQYDGRDIKDVHKGMRITNAEFDAAVGDLKATLDKLQVSTAEQKELLAIVESTRLQVVAER